MKIKLDENLPYCLKELLSDIGHDVDTVLSENLGGQSDTEIWYAAQREQRFLITQNIDFSDLKWFKPGTHYGILLLRLRDCGRDALFQNILTIFRNELVEEWVRCFEVASAKNLHQ